MRDLAFDPSLALLLGVALLLIITMRALFRRRAANSHDTSYTPPKDLSKRSPHMQDAPADMLRWQVELHETARDLKAELDSKMSALQALVAMARQECERLEKLLDRCPPEPTDEHRSS